MFFIDFSIYQLQGLIVFISVIQHKHLILSVETNSLTNSETILTNFLTNRQFTVQSGLHSYLYWHCLVLQCCVLLQAPSSATGCETREACPAEDKIVLWPNSW
jgi:hypothetical protein